MAQFELITLLDNSLFRNPIDPGQTLPAIAGATFQLISQETGKPVVASLVKRKNNLELWHEGEPLLVLEDFYDDAIASQYSADEALVDSGDYSEGGELQLTDSDSSHTDGGFSWLATAGYMIGGAAGVGLALNNGSETPPDYSRDVTVTPLAGPFISEVDVKIYDADGNLLGTGSVDENTGQVTISINDGYTGPILVVVTDINGSAADYISEATGEATSLNGSLRAMMEVTGDGDVSLSVTPLTELAVQLAGVPDTTAELAASPVTSDQVTTNDRVEELLGVSDILGEATTIIDVVFNADDGLNDAETYGDMLAIFSGAEEDLGGIQASVEALAAEITITEGEAELSAAGASILQSGWLTFESGSNADLVETESLVADMPLIAESQFGMLLNEASDGTTIKVNGVSEGDVIHTTLGNTSADYTVTAEMLDGDTASVFIDTATLQAAGEGELELQIQVNDEAPRQPILIEQDLTPPEVLITLGSSSLKSGETTQVTFTFSEAVEGFSADDVQVDNGTLTALTSSQDGLTWTALYVPDDNTENAAANISVLPSFTDLLGNAPASFTPTGSDTQVAAQSAVSVDTSRPTVLINLGADTDLAPGDSTVVTFTFSEAVTDFSLDDIELDYAAASGLATVDGGTTWTVTLMPLDGFESATNSLRLSNEWSDAAGNQPLVFYTSGNYQVDTAAPRIDNVSYLSLAENSGAGQTLLTVSATDLQAITWTLEGQHASAFSYNSATGAVSLNEDPDYETLNLYEVTLVATDASGNRSEHPLLVEITDVDDTAPVFDSGDNARTIDENGPVEVVYTASTDDANATYSLGGTDAAFFSLNGADVTFAGAANYETKDSYQFTITATDAAGNTSTQTITMAVNDLDEVAPVFTSGTSATAVDENGAATVVYTATSDDANATYTLGGTDAASFSIADGVVTFNGSADYETQSSYSFTVTATDAAGNSSDQTVTMAVNDLDEVAPVFTSGATATAVDENGAATVVYTATSDDANATYTLGGTDAASFSITDGVVTFNGSADYETQSSYSFTVTATDAAGNSSDQTVTMAVNDLDEVAPVFTSGTTATTVDENGAATVVYTATSDDANATYTLGGTDAASFSITDGVVTFNGSADYETQSSYSFTVTATDAAGNTSTQTITMAVNDLDEVAPVFTSGATATAVDENGAATVVYTATSDDANATYTLGGTDAASFSIANGLVTFNGSADYETQSSYSFTVIAEDAAGNTSNQTVTMAVNDVDETPPTITSAAEATTVTENSGEGTVVYTVTSDDPLASYSLSGRHASYFSIDEATGEVTLLANADFETLDNYEFTVIATNARGYVSTQEVTMSVTNELEAGPYFIDSSSASNGFVVSWIEQDSSVSPVTQLIYLQSFSENGNPVAGPTVIASTSTSNIRIPDITPLADGNFVVSWEASDASGDYQIYTQMFDSELIALTDEGVVNTVSIGGALQQGSTNIALSDGGYLIAWIADSDGSDALYTQRFDSSGNEVGGNTLVTTGVGFYYSDIDRQMDSVELSDGSFVVIFGSSNSYSAALFDSSGTASQIITGIADTENLYGYEMENPSVVALNNGGFMVIWYESGGTGEPNAIHAQEYDASGVAVGSTLDLASGNINYFSSAANLNDGSFVLTWSERSDAVPGNWNIYAQRFAADGSTLDDAFLVNAQMESDESIPSVSALADGGFVITWDDGQYNLPDGQRFDANGNPVGDSFTYGIYGDSSQLWPQVTGLSGGGAEVELTLDEGDAYQVYQVEGLAISQGDDIGWSYQSLESYEFYDYVSFTLTGADASLFTIGSDGKVYLQSYYADHEMQDAYEFTIVATDNDSGLSAYQSVIISINDLDESRPVFTSGATATAVDENTGANQVVYTASASDTLDIDDDTDNSANVTYSLSGTDADHFTLDEDSGELVLLDDPDYETQSSYEVVITANDDSGNSRNKTVTVAVNDLSEGVPVFAEPVVNLALDENSGALQQVHTATAIDSDAEVNELVYSLGGSDASLFELDDISGELTLIDSPDYEAKSSYSVTVTATDADGQTGSQVVNISVTDLDLADEVSPVIDDQPQVAEIDENTGAGETIYVPNAGETGLTYQLSGPDADALTIDPVTGEVTLNEAPDYETRTGYQFVVIAVDEAGNSQSETIDFAVTNVDEAEPSFWDAVVYENTGANQVVYQATTTDNEDISSGVTYSLGTGVLYRVDSEGAVEAVENDGDFFTIDPNTGELTLLENPDFETRSSYSVSIVATDASGNSAQRLVEIGVEDVAETAVLIDLASGVSSLDADDDRTFNADTSYNIYMLVDSDSSDISLAAEQLWSGVDNLGEDDSIILVGNDGAVLSSTSADTSVFSLTAEAGTGDDLTWGSSASDASFAVDGAQVTRYQDGASTSLDWATSTTDWAEDSSPNEGRDVSVVTLNQLPTSVEDELNWG